MFAAINRRQALAAFGALGATVAASRTGHAQALTDADRADIARIDQYLNSLRTVRARFLQRAQDGRTSQGTFLLSRPGRMRLEYDPPVPILIIVNAGQLLHYDCSLRQSSFQPVSSTPASLLVREQISLNSGELRAISVQRPTGQIRVTVERAGAREGRITFAFSTNPIQLLDWQIIDPQNRATRVQLSDFTTGVDLPNGNFVFRSEAAPSC
jgi:outer membrane lipoprotein-sorting protein